MRMEKKLSLTLGKVCGSCAVAGKIPIDMSKAPVYSNCDECQGHVRTYRRMDNEEQETASLPNLALDK